MDIKLIYLIKAFLLPPTLFISMGILAAFGLGGKYSRLLVVLNLIAVLLCSMPVVVNQIARRWENIPVLDKTSLNEFQPQAIVVLGGGIRKASPEMAEPFQLKHFTLQRVRYAGKIAATTALPVLVSGGAPLVQDQPAEAELMAAYLGNELDIDVRWLDTKSRNTAENAKYSREILEQQGIDRIILVTHAFHMSRALQQFSQNGFDVLPAPTDFISVSDELNVYLFLPDVFALQNSYLIAHEWLGMQWYKLRY